MLHTFPSAHPRTIGPSDGQQMAVTALVWMNLLHITCDLFRIFIYFCLKLFLTRAVTPHLLRFCFYMIHSQISWPRSGDYGWSRIRTRDSYVLCLVSPSRHHIPILGAHTKRLLDKTSPRQNVSIQNVYTHNVSLTKRLLHETSPVTKRLRNKTSTWAIFWKGPDKLS
jgi:hypothetical protein